MIEKIIVQDSSEVHSIWIPERRSLASFVIWKAFGLGADGRWVDGQISLGMRSDWADWPAFPEFPGYMDHSIPEWVDEYLAMIDSAIPCDIDILAAMDADSLTIMLDPPAYRTPILPVTEDLASCVLACRLLIAVRDRLIGPTDITTEDIVSEISHASRLAILVSSDESRRLLLETARSPELCFIIPDAENVDDWIMEEKADD